MYMKMYNVIKELYFAWDGLQITMNYYNDLIK